MLEDNKHNSWLQQYDSTRHISCETMDLLKDGLTVT
jgi:hypothetical protein